MRWPILFISYFSNTLSQQQVEEISLNSINQLFINDNCLCGGFTFLIDYNVKMVPAYYVCTLQKLLNRTSKLC